MTAWKDVIWWSNDGLRLHARDYPGEADTPPILCLPGLTHNARDFDALARRVAGRHRVLAIDLRGRGESAYAKDPMSYVPLTYAQDIAALLADQQIDRFVVIGTSLGGIVAMLLAGMMPGRIAGALLNDVGPEVDPIGLARVRGHVTRSSNWPTWMHAARAIQETHGGSYPDWGIEDWLAMAKRLYRLNNAGRIVIDHDPRIAEPFRVPGNQYGPEMWRALAAFGTAPVLIVRGGRSDILSAAVAERMVAALLEAELVTLPGIGHAPTLSEPAVQGAIDRLLARAGEPPSA
ncbi:alpha/beta fold hydrolase [Sphingomonas dokdonensis]|uniref:Tropinesterase n=1 Tax=Sphingomonas dokdonensis TaxID=344880 RepID=A0A245ZUP0_9SPHN|nr:alpha/beta hydrolase [Sphingomonas dokdonensis]OWK33459.1 tropinesterase [Sphingomonas dokdonensis]